MEVPKLAIVSWNGRRVLGTKSYTKWAEALDERNRLYDFTGRLFEIQKEPVLEYASPLETRMKKYGL